MENISLFSCLTTLIFLTFVIMIAIHMVRLIQIYKKPPAKLTKENFFNVEIQRKKKIVVILFAFLIIIMFLIFFLNYLLTLKQ